MALIDIKRLRIDGGTQHRVKINPDVIAEYAEAYIEGKKLPPVRVVFDGTHNWLWDGFHRVAGAIEAGQKTINVEITRGTQDDAFDLSLGANQDHGLRRSTEDKRSAVKAAMQHPRHAGKSNRQIALTCGVSYQLVNNMRAEETVVKVIAAIPKGDNVVTPAVSENGQSTNEDAGDDDDPKAPGDVKVTRAGVAVVGALAAISAERDEYKTKLIDALTELEAAMAELKLYEQATELGAMELALKAELVALREVNTGLESQFAGLVEERNAAVNRANHWRKKAKAAGAK